MSVAAPLAPPPVPDDLEALIREARARQRRRRAAAAAALVLAAATAFGISDGIGAGRSSATRRGSRSPVFLDGVPRCQSAQLRLSAPKMWGAAAGSLIEQFTLTNRSSETCSVAGWPALRRFDSAGQTIPIRIGREVYEQSGSAPFRIVRLGPGARATFPVVAADWNHEFDRGCRTARSVQVEPRGGGGWLSVSFDKPPLPACRRWYVGPLVPGRLANWPSIALGQFYTLPTMKRPYYSGQMNGTKWQLRIRDSGDGRYCFKVFTNGGLRGSRCGRFYGPGVSGKLGFVYRKGGAEPAFVAGAVISKAQVVAIRLSRGYPLYIQTMQPTRMLAPGIAFFFTAILRDTHPVSIVGSTLDGRRVVSWHQP